MRGPRWRGTTSTEGRAPAAVDVRPGETAWDAAQRMTREREANSWTCRRCDRANPEAADQCECGHQPNAVEKIESRGQPPAAAAQAPSACELQARSAMGLRTDGDREQGKAKTK